MQIDAAHPENPQLNDTNDVRAMLSARYQRIQPKAAPKLHVVNCLLSYSKSYEIVTMDFYTEMNWQLTLNSGMIICKRHIRSDVYFALDLRVSILSQASAVASVSK